MVILCYIKILCLSPSVVERPKTVTLAITSSWNFPFFILEKRTCVEYYGCWILQESTLYMLLNGKCFL